MDFFHNSTFHGYADLLKNELRNAVIQVLGSDPSSPVEGQVYYNSGSHLIRLYTGAAWADLTTGGSGLSNAYASLTDGTTTANASGADTFKVRAAGTGLSVAVVSNDPTHGDNILYTLDSATSGNNKVLLTNGSGKISATTINEVIATTDLTDVASTTGTGTVIVFNAGPTISSANLTGTPAISDFTSATHNHTNTAGGGTLTHAAISDFDTQVRTSRLDQMAVPTADLSINSHKLTNVTDPSSAQDAATKAYVDNLIEGRDWKQSVRVATTTNGTLASSFANGSTVDGVTLATGDRILIKDQSTGSQNGIYVVAASGTPTRATDADASADVTGGFAVWVNEGTTNADTGWVLTTNDPITLGTTALAFTQNSGLGQVTAGAGLTKSGNTLDVVSADPARIVINADNIDLALAGTAGTYTSVTTDNYGRVSAGADIVTGNGIVARTAAGTFTNRTVTGTSNRVTITNGDGVAGNPTIDISSSYVGQATITTLGTIVTGTWTGTTIAAANGGTGQTTAANARGTSGLGSQTAPTTATNVVPTARGIPTKVTAVVTHDGSSVSFTITHNLGTKDVIVQVWDNASTRNLVGVDVQTPDTNTVTLIWTAAQTNGTVFNATVIG